MRTLVDPSSELRVPTHYHRLDGRNNKCVFLPVLGSGESTVKVSAESVSGESPLPGLHTATFWPHPHVVARKVSYVSSHKGH